MVRLFDDSFLEAVGLWERALDEAVDNLALRVPTLVILSLTLFNTGRLAEGVRAAEDAVVNAERLGEPQMLSQALSMRVLLRFIRGDGFDAPSLQRALETEAHKTDVPSRPGLQTVVGPSLQQAMLLGWTGQLDHAHQEMRRIRQHCMNNGEEHELMYVSYYSVQIELWRGDFAEAAEIAEDSMERALQLGGDVTLGGAMTMRAALAAYAGREEQARSDAGAAFAAHYRCGALMLAAWPVTVLGFLELSLGNHGSAITVLEPLLTRFDPAATEIFVASFVPDAVEALVALDRLAEAEPLVDALERNGNRLDRAWMLAVGARCRAMLHAARGDIDAACLAVEAAMDHHDRVPMPFERARTQVLLGQLQRRQRRKDAATATLRDAVRAFDGLGTTLWADRARAELARADVAHTGTEALTPSELRVAELAASGESNRDIAKALFISPKTVEANLARIYRKLDIHSRTQLARHLTPT